MEKYEKNKENKIFQIKKYIKKLEKFNVGMCVSQKFKETH